MIVIVDFFFYPKLKDFCLKKKINQTVHKSFMGFRNKAKKLNLELLILKASVLLSSPEHIRRGTDIFTSKNPLAGRVMPLLIFLILPFVKCIL